MESLLDTMCVCVCVGVWVALNSWGNKFPLCIKKKKKKREKKKKKKLFISKMNHDSTFNYNPSTSSSGERPDEKRLSTGSVLFRKHPNRKTRNICVVNDPGSGTGSELRGPIAPASRRQYIPWDWARVCERECQVCNACCRITSHCEGLQLITSPSHNNRP